MSEQQPLLETGKQNTPEKPFPWRQVLPLCFARLMETWTYWTIFPFLPALVHRIGIPEEQVGYLCGIVEGSFSFAQVITMLAWGRISDRYGRKVVVCSCLLGLTIFSSLFGLATSIWQMVALRSAAGVFCASMVTMRIMISESTDKTATARAFSYFGVGMNIAAILGPIVGATLFAIGDLSELQQHFPILVGRPALLPSLLNGVIGIAATLSVWTFVRETKDQTTQPESDVDRQMTYRQLFASPGVLSFLSLFTVEWAQGSAIRASQAVLFFTRVELGGWGLSIREISLVSGFTGVVAILWSVLGYPLLVSRASMRKIVSKTAFTAFGVHLWCIASNKLLRHRARKAFLALLPVCLAMQTIVSWQLLLNAAAPPGGLGLLWSVGSSLGALQRTMVPAATSSLFALGVQKQILGGLLVFYMLAGIGLAFFFGVQWYVNKHVPEDETETESE